MNQTNSNNKKASNKRIRVLQLGSPTGLYGAERWILALIKHLDPQKIESFVAVIKDDPDLDVPLCKEAAKFGFKTVCFEAHGKVNLSAIKQVRNFILQEKIDILHTHFYKTDIVGFFATRGTTCKIISTPHGWSTDMDFKLWCFEKLDRLFFIFIDAVVPLSDDIYRPFKNIPVLKHKLHLIRNGVDIIEVDSTRAENKRLFSWKKDGFFIIGYIGQLIPRKGLDVLLKAVSQLSNLKWKVVFIGEGEQMEELQMLSKDLKIEENVIFFGFRNDRLSLLKSFDVFVLPSRLEGIPRCLMEAMSANVPVISSDIPGSSDLIENEKTGLLFHVDNDESLKIAIKKIISDKQLREKITHNGRKSVMENFSASRMALDYEILFQKTINS